MSRNALVKSGALPDARKTKTAAAALDLLADKANKVARSGDPAKMRLLATQISAASREAGILNKTSVNSIAAGLNRVATAAQRAGDKARVLSDLRASLGSHLPAADRGSSTYTGPATRGAPSTRRHGNNNQRRRGNSIDIAALRPNAQPIVVYNHMTLDGREVHNSVFRHERNLAEQR